MILRKAQYELLANHTSEGLPWFDRDELQFVYKIPNIALPPNAFVEREQTRYVDEIKESLPTRIEL